MKQESMPRYILRITLVLLCIAVVVAGLLARGETVVDGCSYIYRGYENICRDFRELGARVISV